MSLAIWVRSLQSRIERAAGEKPQVMITYIVAEKEDWNCTFRFRKKGRYKYCRKEVEASDIVELIEKTNRVADDFEHSVTEEELDADSVPF